MLREQGKKLIWKILRLIAGWSLVAVGVIGLFLPILQGLLFIASGLAILSTESRWAKSLLERFSNWRKARKKDEKSP
jgi:uncharacterized membrane protein YbaN (DUF454 family)